MDALLSTLLALKLTYIQLIFALTLFKSLNFLCLHTLNVLYTVLFLMHDFYSFIVIVFLVFVFIKFAYGLFCEKYEQKIFF